MARINIEDSLFTDPRWQDLLIKTGCKHKALGLITSAWILAQKHWVQHKSVPKKTWSKDLDILIEVELAERLNDGSVYVKGSKSAFGWLEQRSNAGKKISEKKVESLKKARAAKSNKTHNGLNGSERTLNSSEPLALSLSLPLTLSQSLSEEERVVCEVSDNQNKTKRREPPPPLDKIWNETVSKLPKVKACGKSRLVKMRSRWLENPDPEFWRGIIKRLEESPFCVGENDRGWVASFDFLLQPDTANKVLEGKYDSKTKKTSDVFQRVREQLGIKDDDISTI